MLAKLAKEKGLKLAAVGSGKKRKLRIEVEPLLEAADTAQASSSSGATGVDNHSATPSQAAPAGPNAALAELAAERKRRQEENAKRQAAEAEARKRANEAKKIEIKQEKKAGKQKQKESTVDDDDLDGLICEFQAKDSTCAYGTCKEKINTLMDMISKCKYCKQRYCLKHAQAEIHGCGDAAQRAEKSQFKDGFDSAMNPRGSGLQQKTENNRNTAASKLQEKIKQQSNSRSTKKPDKK